MSSAFYMDEIMRLRNKFIQAYENKNYPLSVQLGNALIGLYKNHSACSGNAYINDLNNLAIVLDEMKEYEKAAALYKEVLREKKKTEGIFSSDYADTLNNLAILYNCIGKHEKALKVHKNVLKIRQDALGLYHADCLDSLINIGNTHLELKEYDEAVVCFSAVLQSKGLDELNRADCYAGIGKGYRSLGLLYESFRYYEKALDLYESLTGVLSGDYLKVQFSMAKVCEELGDLKQALQRYLLVLELRKKAIGTHLDLIDTIHMAANVMEQLGNYQGAYDLYMEAGAIAKELVGKNHLLFLDSQVRIAWSQFYLGKSNQAQNLYQAIVERKKEVFGGAQNRLFANTLHEWAIFYQETGEEAKAAKLHQQAADIKKAVLGENNLDYAESLGYLGDCYFARQKYEDASEAYRQSKDIREQLNLLDEEYLEILDALIEAQLYVDISKAEQYMYESLNTRLQFYGAFSQKYADGCAVMGKFYNFAGDLDLAIEAYEQAVSILEDIGQDRSPAYTAMLTFLADALLDGGYIERSIEYYGKVVFLRRDLYGFRSGLYAEGLYNLGYAFYCMQRYDDALFAFRNALEVREKIFNDGDLSACECRYHMGLCYLKLKDYNKAQIALGQAFKDLNNQRTMDTMFLSDLLYYLGIAAMSLEDLITAEDNLKQAAMYRRQSYGSKHFLYAQSLQGLGELYVKTEDWEEAAKHLNNAISLYEDLEIYSEAYRDCWRLLGQAYWQSKEFRLAEEALCKAVILQNNALPKDDEKFTLFLADLALFNFELQQYKKAKHLYLKVIEIKDRGHGEPYFNRHGFYLALSYYFLEDYAEAEVLFEKIAAACKECGEFEYLYADCLFYLAQCKNKTSRHEDAFSNYWQWLDSLKDSFNSDDQRYLDALRVVAKEYIGIAEHTEAKELYKTLLKAEKSLGHISCETLSDIGDYYSQIKQWDQSIIFLEKALQATAHGNFEKSAQLHCKLGNAYTAIEEQDTALRHFAAIEHMETISDVCRFEAILSTAKVLKETGRIEKALKYAVKAKVYLENILIEEQTVDYYSFLGTLYFESEAYEEALPSYEQAFEAYVRAGSNDFHLYKNILEQLIILYVKGSQFAKAAEMFELYRQEESTEPLHPSVQWMAGEALFCLNRRQEAEPIFKQLIESSWANEDLAFYYLSISRFGELLLQQKSWEEALTVLSDAVDRPDFSSLPWEEQVRMLKNCAVACCYINDYKGCSGYLEQAEACMGQEEDKIAVNIYPDIGFCYLKMEKYAEAICYYEKSIALIQDEKMKKRLRSNLLKCYWKTKQWRKFLRF